MIHGFPPFRGKQEDEILQNILNTKKIEFKQIMITQEIKDLITCCLQIDIKKRTKWEELFEWRRIANYGDIKFDKAEKSTFCCFFD